MSKGTTLSKRDRGERTPSQRSRLIAQEVAAKSNRRWHEDNAFRAEKRRAKARAEKRKAGPQGGRARALALLDRVLGGITSEATVQMVDRDARGRMKPHRNPDKDRSLNGRQRVRARKAAQREARVSS